ncbi:heterogeneous nuclear ribonucleoprotein M-like [Anolis carolinensis]|uniref:heterogeneous nuclear ribonucleoprotein M-like n=1 Tax=Anolis carolinensis TaxID=28377 RepID=UPI002F2B84F1
MASAVVSASGLESGPKMAEHGGGGGMAPNGAGNGDMPKSDGDRDRPHPSEKRKDKSAKRGGGGSRFQPYGNPSKRYRAFITNIPFDVKWQFLKDLVKEKVGEVTYVELLMDAEGKSRVSLLRAFLLWMCCISSRNGRLPHQTTLSGPPENGDFFIYIYIPRIIVATSFGPDFPFRPSFSKGSLKTIKIEVSPFSFLLSPKTM